MHNRGGKGGERRKTDNLDGVRVAGPLAVDQVDALRGAALQHDRLGEFESLERGVEAGGDRDNGAMESWARGSRQSVSRHREGERGEGGEAVEEHLGVGRGKI